jgi:exoribonuclease-2
MGRAPLSADEVLERTAALDAAGAIVRRAERQSNLHWKMVHLSRNPGWKGEAVVVALEERKVVVIIPELALETRIRMSPDYRLGQTLMLGVREVDVPAQTAYFRVLD